MFPIRSPEHILKNDHHFLHEPIAGRRSPRGFLDWPVDAGVIRMILEAARWSPSSRNEQPWRFIVETKDDQRGYDRLFSTLSASNQSWAVQAPVLVAGVAKVFFDRDNRTNRMALYDTGGAVANLTVQAVVLGLQVHQMGGYNSDHLRELYDIPSGYEPAAVLAVGYADEAKLLNRERSRKELRALVFQGRWGNASSILDDTDYAAD